MISANCTRSPTKLCRFWAAVAVGFWGIFAHPPRGQPPQQSAVSGHFGGAKFNRQGQPIAVIRRPMLIFLIDNLWWPVSITV